ncbi:GrxA family glutaredoxin [Halomonas pacifica]|uniref:Glutaredoxin, GrxA family protein n=1 Tax=Bisbaumannia pacifica TaxID=77098 RepID=A0A510X3J9_9GAMM|nr:GrxA family glutaredoxin [Halomonas pacifica]MBH8580668.1 GrxA family glutaredoxin [Halomonas pacifica]MDC8804778.1 GrxA family glutaredoxin [Halomonas pacifica]GEK45993.1 glutaredoxin, GrxA family protein [Halomonas pacifica]
MFVAIFGRPGCPFCVRAKELAERLSEAKAIEGFRYIDIHEEGITKADMEKTIGKPVETVPQIFVGQTHIGGFTEFDQYVRDQALLPETSAQ